MPDVKVVLLINPASEDEIARMRRNGSAQLFDERLAGRKEKAARLSQRLDGTAAQFPGCLDVNLSTYDNPLLAWALVVGFESATAARHWETSRELEDIREELASSGMAMPRPPILIEEDHTPPAGVAVFTNSVAKNHVGPFVDYMSRVVIAACHEFQGFLGGTLIQSPIDPTQWLSVLVYEDEQHLSSWLNSDERANLLPRLRSYLTDDFTTVTGRSPFGAVVRVVGGRAESSPAWKIILLVVMVLFPTVTPILRFLNPVLQDLSLPPGVISVVGMLIATSFVTVLWMPPVSRLFDRWIDPVRGRSLRVSVIGALVVVGVFAIEIGFFAAFPGLTPWGG